MLYVTRPLLPDFEDFCKQAKEIFDSKWLTNMGEKHNLLEKRLKDELKVNNFKLFNNGTTALLTAIKALALPIGSEIITTPFTFAATPHCISWNGCIPVFCDIEPNTFTIDCEKIESLITSKTSAILAVHVYGFPCDVYKIEKIAKKHNLKVIYDAAHAFSSELNGKGIGTFGDITMFSFHSTKLFNTIEGGGLAFNDFFLNRKIYNLRNFGIQNEEIVEDVGINGKMNEFQAAMGLLNLKIYKQEQEKRKKIFNFYNEELNKTKGIYIPKMPSNCTHSYQYFPIVIQDDYPLSRDELYDKLKANGVHARKYFYPACTDYECYKHFVQERDLKLDNVNNFKHRVLCLPFYGELTQEDCNLIVNLIK